jgi:glycosyltransferase EpsE
MGLNQTLNDCLDKARGTFIARMDGDDISLPQRFERQLKEFEADPKLAVVSCPMIYFDEGGDWYTGVVRNEYPTIDKLAAGTIHCHGPCMVRTDVMRAVGGYTVDNQLLRVEDWNLWMKIYAKGYYGKNIPDVLYKMRDDRNAKKRRTLKNRLNEAHMTILVVKTFDLPIYMYGYMLRPIIVGLLPAPIYELFHKRKLSTRKNG